MKILYLFIVLLFIYPHNVVDAQLHERNHHHDQQKDGVGALTTSKLNVYPIQNFRGELYGPQFPEGFVFGSAESAYQEDVGFDAYHLSISWRRIFPEGVGVVNNEGVQYYHKLLNALLEEGIEPFVTIYNRDMPVTLEESMNGWLNPKIVYAPIITSSIKMKMKNGSREVFGEFARFCFQEFGGKVKKWLTFNELHSFVQLGYPNGGFPPQSCSRPYGNCIKGNSQVEPWIAAHNALNGHAHVVNIYRKEFQKQQRGTIGIKNNCMWYKPNSDEEKEGAQGALKFYLGWFMGPIIFGDYPASMRQYLGFWLPQFTQEQKALLKGSYDWIGFNHSSTRYAYYPTNASIDNDSGVGFTRKATFFFGSICITAERNRTIIAPVVY